MPRFNEGDRVVSNVNAQGLKRFDPSNPTAGPIYEVTAVETWWTPVGGVTSYRVLRIDQPDDGTGATPNRPIDVGNGHLVLSAAPGPCAVTCSECGAAMNPARATMVTFGGHGDFPETGTGLCDACLGEEA